jgi:hypothetical protein
MSSPRKRGSRNASYWLTIFAPSSALWAPSPPGEGIGLVIFSIIKNRHPLPMGEGWGEGQAPEKYFTQKPIP